MKNYFLSAIILIVFSTIFFNCQNNNKVEVLLEKEIATENARCPIQVNEYVFFDSCKLLPNRVIQYYYRLNLPNIDSSIYINQYKPIMIEQLKKQPTAALYQKENVGFRYIYSNTQGEYLFRINVSPDEYK